MSLDENIEQIRGRYLHRDGVYKAARISESAHEDEGVVLDVLYRQAAELATCRSALDKTAIERDRFHDELLKAQAQVLRVAMAIDSPDLADQIRQIAADAECAPSKCQRVADGVVGLLRLALNPKAKS